MGIYTAERIDQKKWLTLRGNTIIRKDFSGLLCRPLDIYKNGCESTQSLGTTEKEDAGKEEVGEGRRRRREKKRKSKKKKKRKKKE